MASTRPAMRVFDGADDDVVGGAPGCGSTAVRARRHVRPAAHRRCGSHTASTRGSAAALRGDLRPDARRIADGDGDARSMARRPIAGGCSCEEAYGSASAYASAAAAARSRSRPCRSPSGCRSRPRRRSRRARRLSRSAARIGGSTSAVRRGLTASTGSARGPAASPSGSRPARTTVSHVVQHSGRPHEP